jgi:hypothetical protein
MIWEKHKDDLRKTSGRFGKNVRTIWKKRQDDLGKTSGRFGENVRTILSCALFYRSRGFAIRAWNSRKPFKSASPQLKGAMGISGSSLTVDKEVKSTIVPLRLSDDAPSQATLSKFRNAASSPPVFPVFPESDSQCARQTAVRRRRTIPAFL